MKREENKSERVEKVRKSARAGTLSIAKRKKGKKKMQPKINKDDSMHYDRTDERN